MWCSLHVTCGDNKDNVRTLHTNFLCSCVQTHEFLKNTRVELQNTLVLNRVVPYVAQNEICTISLTMTGYSGNKVTASTNCTYSST